MKAKTHAPIAVASFAALASAFAGVEIPFSLPDDGNTYLVTLAVTEKANPDRIVSTFVAGQPFATAPGKGSFTATWDGLDENFMPVPAGEYGVKGIYSLAAEDPIDHEMHSIRARYHSGPGAFLPPPDTPEIWKIPIPFHGDPVNSPLADVCVTPSGRAVFYYQYLENGRNCPIVDLSRPYGYGQFVRAFPSGGAGGGPCATTDGEMVWACSTDGAPFFIYRADARPFGKDDARHRRGGFLPQGFVTDMACWRGDGAPHAFVYVIQRGKIAYEPIPNDSRKRTRMVESQTDLVDEITVFNGDNGDILARVPVSRPRAIAVRGDTAYLLYRPGDAADAVGSLPIVGGIPQGEPRELFRIPAEIRPSDLAVDSRGRFYVSDPKSNHVFQFDSKGKRLRSFGARDAQEPGSFDPSTFMTPTRLSCWTDREGRDRLLVVESAGPNRVTEWDGSTGVLVTEYPSFQTKANSGYAIDPANPSHVYLPVHQNWLARYVVDYDKGEWRLDAVFPDVVAGQRKGLDKPVAIRAGGRLYLASSQSGIVYRLTDDGRRFLRSAGVVQDGKDSFVWNDENGNGEIDDSEKRPIQLPGLVYTYHGQNWIDGLTYLAAAQGSRDVWALSPDSFDSHGNPVFTAFRHVVRDPFFEARATGNPGALEGGNELAETFSSDWMQADGTPGGPIFVQARGGRNFSANFGAQHKITRYDPDSEGRYKMTWRVGRTNIAGGAKRGELAGGMRIFRPRNGILAVIDQSRSGVFLYTDDGLYIDTLFAPGATREELGVYRQPGEFFAGTIYDHRDRGRIYYASGKYTPFLYEIENWSLRENPVKRLATLPATVSIDASQIADPPEKAIALRGGPGRAKFAEVGTAFGGVELDGGSMAGWESAQPVAFQGGKGQDVEARVLYDPDHLYIRWHVRTGSAFEGNPPLADFSRIYSHDAPTDITSLYLGANGGEARVVFGIWKRAGGGAAEPYAIAFHPKWAGASPNPVGFKTPVNETRFAHVEVVARGAIGSAVDKDGKGYVIAAALPRSAFPFLREPFSGSTRLSLNFDANLGGHNRFWWANTDGSASTETYDEPTEARLYPGSWATARFASAGEGLLVSKWVRVGPFGGDGAEKFSWDPRNKDEVSAFYEKAVYPLDGEAAVDVKETFHGPLARGWWGGASEQRPLRWTPVSLDELDTRFRLGDAGSQVWFGATWIHSEKEVEVDFEFFSHNMTHLRWRLNGEPIAIGGPKDYKPDPRHTHRHNATRTVTLRKGWNEVWVRGYCVGYAPFRAGLVIHAPESVLWTLRSTNVQPR